MSTITLLTDFGHQDPYVGIMKGVIATRCPEATVIDLCHEVEPQNVAQASYLLETSYRYFPAGTIHVAVVDPGVGSDRRAIGVRVCEHVFVAPDNGLLWAIVMDTRPDWIVNVTNRSYFLDDVSSTFHGRDVFAPVGAALACGADASQLGQRIGSIQELEAAQPSVQPGGTANGTVVHVDRFGNLITNFTESWLAERHGDPRTTQVCVGQRLLRGVSQTYADVEPGQALALIGSTGRLEISVNGGSAAQELSAGLGTTVSVNPTN